jgi:TonB family protein
MPSWKGCETQKSEEKKIECTKREISEFITKNIQYPENAKKNNTKGTVFVTFVIDREGNVVSPKIIRGINDELDTEAMRVINLIPAFNPGLQRGKPVQVQYNIPVKFPPN